MAKEKWVEDSVGLNKRDRILKQVIYNLILILVCIAVLWPVLWVVQMAFTPNGAVSIGGEVSDVSYTLQERLSNFDYVIFRQNDCIDLTNDAIDPAGRREP